jgi:hypothetical protein
MSLFSKAEILYLQGQKQVSKSYDYKLKSIIKKKVANLMEKEIPLLSALFPNLDLTKFGKISKDIHGSLGLTDFGKTDDLKKEKRHLTGFNKKVDIANPPKKTQNMKILHHPATTNYITPTQINN